MSIQAFKSVEIGLGRAVAERTGSQVHDPIVPDADKPDGRTHGLTRTSNNAGGIEGGMSNGMPIVVTGAMKPISTLLRGLPSVNLQTGEEEQSAYERSDVCAVSAASVVQTKRSTAVVHRRARSAIDRAPTRLWVLNSQ